MSQEEHKSRGQLRLEKSADIAETILENTESSETETPVYAEHNAALDDLLEDATTTQEETRQQEREESQEQSEKVSIQEAMQLAVFGLDELVKMVSEKTGKNIELGNMSKTIFASLTAPLIQKYKPKMSIDPEGVNLDSWMPEMLAAGGILSAAVPMYWQVKTDENVTSQKADEKTQGAKSGD